MKIILNGKPYDAHGIATIEELLANMELAGRPVVVELNRRALLPREHASATLDEGAVVEVVQITAGG
jgi:thiamine biosynthesis protein ThiS